ncbi:MAG: BPSS1780 family membrane protein [Xanthomonadales bacterium]|nr:BPSS1780 family membrane protein [Xanthomonadales bacterium]
MNSQENNSQITANRFPAGRGLAWLMQSLALIKAQAGRLLFMAVLLQLILGLSQVPILGMLVILALPAFSAGLLEAFHRVETGALLPASILFVPIAQKPANGRLLLLGLLMFATSAIAVMLVMGGVDTQLDPELLKRIEQGDAEALAMLDPALISKVLIAALLAVSLSGTISFLAIPLIWFHNMPMLKALLTGLRGLARNWQPFLVLGLGMMVLLIPVLVFLGLMVGLASSISPLSLLFLVLLMLAALLFQLVVLGTQYCACRDIFGLGATAGEADNADGQNDSSNDDGQLLA